jgi:hypothetical protein
VRFLKEQMNSARAAEVILQTALTVAPATSVGQKTPVEEWPAHVDKVGDLPSGTPLRDSNQLETWGRHQRQKLATDSAAWRKTSENIRLTEHH